MGDVYPHEFRGLRTARTTQRKSMTVSFATGFFLSEDQISGENKYASYKGVSAAADTK